MPVTKVLGKLACNVCAMPLGISQAERSWKAMKRNKSGKSSRLSSDKTKKQPVVCAAYSHEKSEARQVQAQKTGKLWSKEDFAWHKMDNYCTGSVVEHIKTGPVCVFRAWQEHWEKSRSTRKGTQGMQLWCLPSMEDSSIMILVIKIKWTCFRE